MGKKKSNLEATADQMRRYLNFPVINYHDSWWGGLIDGPSKMLKYVLLLAGHGCWNGKKGSEDHYLAVDIMTTKGEYLVYDCWKKSIVALENNSALSMGKALLVYPAPKGQIAKTELGAYPASGRDFNLSYGVLLGVA